MDRGHPVLGYDIDPKGGRIIVNPVEAAKVRTIFGLYIAQGSLLPVLQETERIGLVSKQWTTEDGKVRGWQTIHPRFAARDLTNVLYTGMVDHKGVLYRPLLPAGSCHNDAGVRDVAYEAQRRGSGSCKSVRQSDIEMPYGKRRYRDVSVLAI